jgi:hypothetical protein
LYEITGGEQVCWYIHKDLQALVVHVPGESGKEISLYCLGTGQKIRVLNMDDYFSEFSGLSSLILERISGTGYYLHFVVFGWEKLGTLHFEELSCFVSDSHL